MYVFKVHNITVNLGLSADGPFITFDKVNEVVYSNASLVDLILHVKFWLNEKKGIIYSRSNGVFEVNTPETTLLYRREFEKMSYIIKIN